METNNTSTKKIKHGTADLMLVFFLAIMLLFRSIFSPILLHAYGIKTTMILLFLIPFALASIFIFVSNYYKIDWRCKKQPSLIGYLIRNSEKYLIIYILLCFIFFFLDSFLLFVYTKNGTSNFFRKILAWILLASSLIFSSFYWMEYGTIF